MLLCEAKVVVSKKKVMILRAVIQREMMIDFGSQVFFIFGRTDYFN